MYPKIYVCYLLNMRIIYQELFYKGKEHTFIENDNAYTHIIFRNHLIKIKITLPIANYFRSKR